MSHFERVWAQVPEGVEPEAFGLRCGWLLERVEAGERVVDLGCGEGWFTAALAAHGCRVVGVDVAAEAIRRARERHPECEFAGAAPGGEWDAVWLGEVVEHVQDVEELLEQARGLLRPGGRLLISTPDHGLPTRLRLLGSRAWERHFDPRSDHVRFFTAGSLRALTDDRGLEQVELQRRRGRLLLSCRRPGPDPEHWSG